MLGFLQRLGKAFMLPIAVLPAAGLLLRLGQDDLLDIPFIAAAGDAVFSNLALIFAVVSPSAFKRWQWCCRARWGDRLFCFDERRSRD